MTKTRKATPSELSPEPVGDPFRVTAFERPSLMVPQQIEPVLSLSQDRLVLTLEEVSGAIWVLDNVDR